MHRHKWSDVGTFEQGAPLQESEGPIHELHVRRRQLGTDMASRRESRPQLFAVHQVSNHGYLPM